MTLVQTSALALAALALLGACASSDYKLSNLNDEERANFARSSSACDNAGAEAARDATSPCYLAGRRGPNRP